MIRADLGSWSNQECATVNTSCATGASSSGNVAQQSKQEVQGQQQPPAAPLTPSSELHGSATPGTVPQDLGSEEATAIISTACHAIDRVDIEPAAHHVKGVAASAGEPPTPCASMLPVVDGLREMMASMVLEHGPNHKISHEIMLNLANALCTTHQLAEAESLYRQVMEARLKVLGPGHELYVMVQDRLAACLYQQDRHEEALMLWRNAAARHLKHLHSSASTTTMTTIAAENVAGTAGSSCSNGGDSSYADGEKDVSMTLGFTVHIAYIACLMNCVQLTCEHKLSEAMNHLRSMLTQLSEGLAARAWRGLTSRQLVVTLGECGCLVGQAGHWNTVCDTFRSLVNECTEYLGASHPDTLIARDWCAYATFNLGTPDAQNRAIEEQTQVVDAWQQRGGDNPYADIAGFHLARRLAANRRHVNAAAVLKWLLGDSGSCKTSSSVGPTAQLWPGPAAQRASAPHGIVVSEAQALLRQCLEVTGTPEQDAQREKPAPAAESGMQAQTADYQGLAVQIAAGCRPPVPGMGKGDAFKALVDGVAGTFFRLAESYPPALVQHTGLYHILCTEESSSNSTCTGELLQQAPPGILPHSAQGPAAVLSERDSLKLFLMNTADQLDRNKQWDLAVMAWRQLLELLREDAPSQGEADEQQLREVEYLLGFALVQAGQYAEALHYYLPSLAYSEKHYGTCSEVTLDKRRRVATVFLALKQAHSALKHLRLVHECCLGLHGPDGEATLTAETRLAEGYRLAGENLEAIRLLRLLRAKYQRLKGPEHALTVDCEFDLALCLSNQSLRNRRYRAEALDLSRHVVQWRTANLGLNDAATIQSMHNMCVVLMNRQHSLEEAAEALPLLQEALSYYTRVHGEQHGDAIEMAYYTALALMDADRVDEAVPLLQRAMAWRQREWGNDSDGTRDCQEKLQGATMLLLRRASGDKSKASKMGRKAGAKSAPSTSRDLPQSQAEAQQVAAAEAAEAAEAAAAALLAEEEAEAARRAQQAESKKQKKKNKKKDLQQAIQQTQSQAGHGESSQQPRPPLVNPNTDHTSIGDAVCDAEAAACISDTSGDAASKADADGLGLDSPLTCTQARMATTVEGGQGSSLITHCPHATNSSSSTSSIAIVNPSGSEQRPTISESPQPMATQPSVPSSSSPPAYWQPPLSQSQALPSHLHLLPPNHPLRLALLSGSASGVSAPASSNTASPLPLAVAAMQQQRQQQHSQSLSSPHVLLGAEALTSPAGHPDPPQPLTGGYNPVLGMQQLQLQLQSQPTAHASSSSCTHSTIVATPAGTAQQPHSSLHHAPTATNEVPVPLQAPQPAPPKAKVECCVCLSMRTPVTFQPCGHAICCKGCARQVAASTRPVCPYCDVPIQGMRASPS